MSSIVIQSRPYGISTWLREAVSIALASLAIAVLAQVSIPIGPVPITGQTLAVLGAAWMLGRLRGTTAVAFYLAWGAFGLPVFAGGTAGFVVFAGPTGGYLAGFLVAAYTVGAVSDSLAGRNWNRNPALIAAAAALGTAIVYALGATVLARFVGWDRVVAVGIAPFLPGDALKIGLLATVVPALASARPRA